MFKAMPDDTWDEVRRFSLAAGRSLKIPVLVDPPELSDLDARVEYVLPRSPAAEAGIKAGDLIVGVAGKEVFSRKDAFQTAFLRENPVITVRREGLIEFRLRKGRLSSPGFVVYDDLDREEYLSWERTCGIAKGRDVLVLTSSLAKPLIQAALKKRGLDARVVTVRSTFFGGNILAGGLLTVGDFLSAFKKANRGKEAPYAVTLPARAFDPWGRDLEGIHVRTFTQKPASPSFWRDRRGAAHSTILQFAAERKDYFANPKNSSRRLQNVLMYWRCQTWSFDVKEFLKGKAHGVSGYEFMNARGVRGGP